MFSRQLRWLSVLLLIVAVVVLPTPRAAAQGEFLSINPDEAVVVEGNTGATAMTFTITVSPTTSQTVSGVASTEPLSGASFTPATEGGSCGAGIDYLGLTNQPFTIPPNTASTTLTVNVCGDTIDEGDEHFTVTLGNVTGGAQCFEGTCISIGEIHDNEPLVTVTGPATNPVEPATGTTTANFTVTFSPVPTRSFTLDLGTFSGGAIAGNSCATAGVDVLFVADVTVNPGESSRTIPVTICADDRDEPVQDFSLNVLDGDGYEPGTPAQASANIIDEDARPVLTINNVSAPEGQPCTTQFCLSFTVATFTVTLSRVSEFTVTATATPSNGTATGGSGVGCSGSGTADFLNASSTVTFNPTQTSRSVGVKVCKDSAFEANETYQVTLSSPSFATCTGGDCTGLGTIENDDSQSGTFAVTPQAATVAVNEHLPLTVVWTVPSGQVWRDLDTIDVIADADRTAIWVRWDEAANTFSLCEAAAGEPTPVDATCDTGGTPGSKKLLQTSRAKLHLAGSSVTGSGPLGQDVTLVLDLSFKGGAGGKTFDVSVAASDDLRNQDTAFLPAGSVQVTRPT